MKNWKIKNLLQENVKFICKIGENTKGIVLNPNEFCIADAQQTAFIKSQERKGFIQVDREFDNSKYNLEIGVVYSEDVLKTKSKLEIAKEDAKKYIDKN
jgi:hypothetical protein